MAEANAVRQHMSAIDKELTHIANRAEKKGAAVGRVAPVDKKADPTQFSPDAQDPASELMGAFAVGADNLIIRLNKKGNLSTLLHETGHLFLEMEGRFAAEQGVTENQQAILDWLGAETFTDITREQHEKWARSYEAYLREGLAPSNALRSAFSAFGLWLRRIYATLTDLDVRLDDDVRQIFDRLLASETAIAEIRANPAYDSLFKSQEQAGMTDEQWAEYQAKKKKAATRAQENLDRTLVDELRRHKTKEWRQERAEIAEDEKIRIKAQPIYQAHTEARMGSMDVREVKDILGLAESDKLPPKLNMISRKPRNGEAGVSVEAIASSFNLDPKEMLQQFAELPAIGPQAETLAQQRMLEKYGDVLNDGTIEEEAAHAMHNGDQEALLVQELRTLKRQAKSTRTIDRKYIKAKAQQHVGTMTRKQLKPERFRRNERKAAVKASQAKSPDAALQAKIQQAVNFYLYSEAVKARDKFDTNLKQVRKAKRAKYDDRKVMNEEYGNAAREHLNMYDFRVGLPKKASPQDIAARKASAEKVLNWFRSQVPVAPGEKVSNDNIDMAGDLHLWDINLIEALKLKENDPEGYANYKFPHYADMTVDQMQGIADMNRHLVHVGRQLSDTVKSEFKAKQARAVLSIRENSDGRKGGNFGETGVGKWSRFLGDWGYGMVTLKNLLRRADNAWDRKDQQGVMDEYIHQPLEESQATEITLGLEMREMFETELAGLSEVGLKSHRKTNFKFESGEEVDWSEQGIFYMSLLWGTQSGREALLDGYGMTETEAMSVMSTLAPAQLEMLNKVWKVLDHLWPELQAASFRRYGVAPEKIDTSPFMVNGVEMDGGYAPLSYLPGTGRGPQTADDDLRSFHGADTSATLGKASALYERLGSGGRKPKLAVDLIQTSVDRNIHFIAFADSSFAINNLLKSSSVRNEMAKYHSLEFYNAIVKTVRGVTIGQRDTLRSSWLNTTLGQLRAALTARHLSYSVKNSVEQFSTLPLAVEEVGAAGFAKASIELMDPALREDISEQIHRLAPYMKDRATFVNREAAMNMKKLTASKTSKMWQDFAHNGFIMQSTVDKMFAYPIWWAKFNAIMEEGAVNDNGALDYEALEQHAARAATQAVVSTVGSGADLHLGGMYQSTNHEAVKLFTMFGSWWNMRFNRMYRESHGFQATNAEIYKNPYLYSSFVVTPLAVGVMTAILTFDAPEDEDAAAEWVAQRFGTQIIGGIAGVKDIYSVTTQGYANQSVYSGGLNAVGMVASGTTAVVKGEKDVADWLGLLFTGASTVLPLHGSRQLEKIVEGVQATDDRGPLEILIQGKR